MALVKVSRETWRSYSVDLGRELQATEYYIVYFDAPTTPIAAEMAEGIPLYTQPHPDDSRRLLKQKRPQMVGEESNRMHWEVQCDYSNLVNPQPNPLLRPATIQWDFDNATEDYAYDYASEYPSASNDYGPISGNQPVVNTAGSPFPAVRDAGTWSANYSKNVAPSFTIASEINVMECVNNDNFPFDGATIAQYSAKISGGSLSVIQTENGFQFRTVTYKIKFKNNGWIDYIANFGLEDLFSGGGKRKAIVLPATSDSPAENATTPWPLDEDGIAYATATTKPDRLSFYPYHTTAFAPIFITPAYTVFGGGFI